MKSNFKPRDVRKIYENWNKAPTEKKKNRPWRKSPRKKSPIGKSTPLIYHICSHNSD